MVAAFGRVRELMSPGHLLSNVRRYAAVIPDLPQRLDEVLTAAAEGCTPLHLRVRETGNRRGLASADTVTAIMLLALAAVALVGQHLTHTGSLDGWMAKTGGVLILAAGGFLLGRLCGAPLTLQGRCR